MNTPHTQRNSARSRAILYRFSQVLVVAVLFLLVAGAMVTSTGSGLSVPDWPLSFGQVMPPMEGGVFYEHGHRMVATGVGILTVILAFALWRLESRPWMRSLGWIALTMVILQGVLGGLTVLMQLPVWTSAAHACLAQGFLMLVVFISLALSPGWYAPGVTRDKKSGLAFLAVATTTVIYIQLILGAVMRHMNAGLVIPDFPMVYGGLVPPHFTPAVAVHYGHRVWAIVVVIMVVVTLIATLKTVSNRRDFTRPAGFMLGVVLLQACLGAMIILSERQIHITSTHVVTGAVLLAASTILSVRAWRFLGAPGMVSSSGPVQPSPLGETVS